MAKFIPVNQLEPLQVNVSDIAAKWKKWKRDFSNYADALAGEDLTDQRKVGLLKHVIGDEGNDIFDSFTFLKEDGSVDTKPTYATVIAKFDAHFVPKTNITFERYKFFTCVQLEGEAADSYLAKLRQLAKSCEFQDLEGNLIRDVMVVGLNNVALREKLLQVERLTLDRCIELCRTEELTRQRSNEIQNGNGKEEHIDAIRKKQHYQKKKPTGYNNAEKQHKEWKAGSSKNSNSKCTFCGYEHKPRQCPAYGKICKKCNKRGHFAHVCKKGKYINEIDNENHSEEDSDEDEDESFKIDCIDKDSRKSRKKRWYEKIEVNEKATIDFKVDTGADVNTIPKHLYEQVKRQENLLPTNENLYNYSSGYVTSMGRCFLPCVVRDKKFVLVLHY